MKISGRFIKYLMCNVFELSNFKDRSMVCSTYDTILKAIELFSCDSNDLLKMNEFNECDGLINGTEYNLRTF